MSVRRRALDSLTRPRLLDLAGVAEVVVPASAPRPDILDKVSRKSSVPLRTLLGEFSRDELKLACHHLDLDTTGIEKSRLVRRIVALARAEGRVPTAAKRHSE